MKNKYWVYILLLFFNSCVCGNGPVTIGIIKNNLDEKVIIAGNNGRSLQDEHFAQTAFFIYVPPNTQDTLEVNGLKIDQERKCTWYFYYLDAAMVDSLFAKTTLSPQKIYRKALIGYKKFSNDEILNMNIKLTIDSSFLNLLKKSQYE